MAFSALNRLCGVRPCKGMTISQRFGKYSFRIHSWLHIQLTYHSETDQQNDTLLDMCRSVFFFVWLFHFVLSRIKVHYQSRFPAAAPEFYFRHSVHTVCGYHPCLSPTGKRLISPFNLPFRFKWGV